ncbi:helix-turn-helix transcriptional regulator [Agrobacterium larrymoorei]|uniref:helix-turn-helix transcriptional regulator n=1 Tax=Agrobacterium larrymoorei TaxID=160699 RepID=UPI0030C612FD
MYSVRSNLITGEEVRERFGGISDATLGRWVKTGVIPRGIKVGRRRLFDVRELEAVVEAKKAERN